MSSPSKRKEKDIIDALLKTSFDIENAFLVLKDKENLNFLSFSEKDDEIVKKIMKIKMIKMKNIKN